MNALLFLLFVDNVKPTELTESLTESQPVNSDSGESDSRTAPRDRNETTLSATNDNTLDEAITIDCLASMPLASTGIKMQQK